MILPRLTAWWARRPHAQRRRLLVACGALTLTAIALWARLPDLDAYLNIDAGHGWMGRTRRFWQAIEREQWHKTFQKTHPGVTLMWLAGPFLEHGPGWTSTPTPLHVAAGAAPVALIGALLAPLTSVMWLRLMGPRHIAPAFIAGFIIATEPYLVALSRTMHLDQLLTAFGWIGLLAVALMLRRGRWRWAWVAGVCFGLAVLTKISAGAIAVGGGLWCISAWLNHPSGFRRWRCWKIVPQLALMTLVAVAVVYAVWPALWEQPEKIIERLIKEGEALVKKGHRTFFLGETSDADAGMSFYAVLALYKTSPEVLLTMLVGAWVTLRRRSRLTPMTRHTRRVPVRGIMWGLLLAHLPMAMVLTLGAKKMDRYLLPFMPLMSVFAAYGLWWVIRTARRLGRRWPQISRQVVWISALAVGMLALGRSGRLIRVHPYAIAWAAEWMPIPAEEAIQMGWGEGMREVGAWISEDAGPKARPKVWSGMHQTLRPYLPAMQRVKSHKEADYLVYYLSIRQRRWWSGHFKRYGKTLLHEVKIEGRVYAQIWSGPRYHQMKRPPRR
ncbi:MAG: ArnT family glycosyltransferase [Bradymonadia bacterium]